MNIFKEIISILCNENSICTFCDKTRRKPSLWCIYYHDERILGFCKNFDIDKHYILERNYNIYLNSRSINCMSITKIGILI